jgi:hypothetical protein
MYLPGLFRLSLLHWWEHFFSETRRYLFSLKQMLHVGANNSPLLSCSPTIGGPAQDLSNFQLAPIPILSVPTCSTSSPHAILKVSKKIIGHNPPVGLVKRVIDDPGGFSYRFFCRFWTRFDPKCTIVLLLLLIC